MWRLVLITRLNFSTNPVLPIPASLRGSLLIKMNLHVEKETRMSSKASGRKTIVP